MAAVTLLVLGSLWLAASAVPGPRLESSAQAAVAQQGDAQTGEAIYVRRCSPCHGLEGDGNGPAAPYLNPRPRDFTQGRFKLRTTSSGDAPLESDLIQTVKKGIPGTAMPTWEGTLSNKDIQDVVAYIKTFDQFDTFNPNFAPEVVDVGKAPSITDELVARGEELYQRVECWKCHGDGGRADGVSAPTLEDDWGFSIRARNLTKGWQFKRGVSIEEIYTRLSTGMDGSPMPSFLFDLPDGTDRWAIAAYVAALAQEEPTTSQVVLSAKEVSGPLPTTPEDPLWEKANAIHVPMTGQVVAAPRWQNHSVDMLTVKALHNGQEVAFLLEWDDPHKDVTHVVGPEDDRGLNGTYADWEVYGPKAETPERPLPSYRDAVALQLPRAIPEGPSKPHFLWGRASDPVNLWMWKADLQEESGSERAVEQMRARGHLVERGEAAEGKTITERMDALLAPYPPEQQNVWGQGSWEKGTWKVVMKRALDTGNPQDTLMETGKLIPISFQAWDGSNGEQGLMMSISSWHFLRLETPTSLMVYLYALGGIVGVGVLEVGLVRWVRRRHPST